MPMPWPHGDVMAIASPPTASLASRPAREGDRVTLAEYLDCAELDTRRWELWDGRLVEAGVPLDSHQDVIEGIIHAFRTWARAAGIDIKRPDAPYVRSDVFVDLGDGNMPRPDVTIVRAERRGIVRDKVYGAPDAVVEVLSKSDRRYVEHDRTEKLQRYARAGIPVYVIFDIEERQAECYRLHGDAYVLDGTLGDGDTLEFDALPGFSVPITELLPPPPPAAD
jgi:Uma2 family endonuclease